MRVQILHSPAHRNPKAMATARPGPPLGLAYIAAALRNAGHDVSVIDGLIEGSHQHHLEGPLVRNGLTNEQILERIHPDTQVLAMGMMWSSSWPFMRGALRMIKEARPDLTIVCGGEHFTAVPEGSMRQAPIDFVVMGEGEEIIVNLLDEVQKDRPDFAKIDGICWRDGDRIVRNQRAKRIATVDEIAPPAWDLFDLEAYNSREYSGLAPVERFSIPVLATRGCPYQCTFCSSPNTWTPRWNARDPLKVLDEIEGYVRTYGANYFPFQDLTMIIRKSWLITFCQAILERGLDIEWSLPTGTRGEIIDPEVADLLYRSGCRYISLAPETGDQELRNAIKKKMKTEKVKSAVSLTSGELSVNIFLVIGFPQETNDTLKATVRMVRELGRLGAHDVSTSFFFPIPSTVLFASLEERGRLKLDDMAFLAPQQMHTDFLDDEYNFTDAVTTRRLNFTKYWIALNFYVAQWIAHPKRFVRFVADVITGEAHSRLADVFRHKRTTRRERRKQQREATVLPRIPWEPEGPIEPLPDEDTGAAVVPVSIGVPVRRAEAVPARG